MELRIINEENLELSGFCEWLLPKIKDYIVENINIRKLQKFNGVKWGDYKINNLYPWVIETLNFLEIKKRQQDYIIQINSTAKVGDISVINLAKFINYGNLEISGYPIYDEAFNFFANNLQYYYSMYQEGL